MACLRSAGLGTASKVVGTPQKQLCDLYTRTVKKRAKMIMADTSYPLCQHFELLPSGQRLRNLLLKRMPMQSPLCRLLCQC
jgi:hypothetical protein